MRAAEFLRDVVNMLSSMDGEEEHDDGVEVNIHGGHQTVEMPGHDEHEHEEPELDPNPVMVPPLQQKIEIMKKMAGLPNQADKFTAIVADEDEPFEG
jgi:hypothetical protein